MGKQLYSVYEKATLPGKAIPTLKNTAFKGKNKTIQNFVLIRWPNGRPCHLANLWLEHICASTNARDTAKTYAAQITAFIRFCYTCKISILEFTESNFVAMKNFLVEETIATRTGTRPARNNNQTKQIQIRTLELLYWLTNNYPDACTHKLVGPADSGANITIEIKTNSIYGKTSLHHPEIVSPVPYNDDKVPVDESTINKLQNEIFRKHDLDNLPTRSKLKAKNNSDIFFATNTYLYERRIFLLRMMKLMGLRPEELHELPLTLNQNVLLTKEIVAPTKKRGFPIPLRRFKVDLRSARLFNRYIEARKEYIDFLQTKGIYCSHPKEMFIGENGCALKKASLTKEFDRLCEGAGLLDYRVCLSMFRHRFVTREIYIRLEARLAANSELRNGWTPGLRDDVCLEVAELTGHANPASLYNYFYAEYRAITSSSSYSEKLKTREELDSTSEELVDLEHQSRLRKIDITEELLSLRARIDKLHAELFGFK